jgi:hypothetical protein
MKSCVIVMVLSCMAASTQSFETINPEKAASQAL